MNFNNIYKRDLPSSCIDFSSVEGKQVFREALDSGCLESYFLVGPQLRTQDDPSFCGLATLVVALNAFRVDPGRVWKGVWRWFHENMLDCCDNIESIKKRGITLEQFQCTANCNGLKAEGKRLDTIGQNESKQDSNESESGKRAFRKLVMEASRDPTQIVIVNYDRGTLGQTGTGHFACISGFHPARDLVLILETARFKYPCHWVSVELMWRAMSAIEAETGRPRGYIVARRNLQAADLVLLSTAPRMNTWINQSPSRAELEQAVAAAASTSNAAFSSCSSWHPGDVGRGHLEDPTCCDNDIWQDAWMALIDWLCEEASIEERDDQLIGRFVELLMRVFSSRHMPFPVTLNDYFAINYNDEVTSSNLYEIRKQLIKLDMFGDVLQCIIEKVALETLEEFANRGFPVPEMFASKAKSPSEISSSASTFSSTSLRLDASHRIAFLTTALMLSLPYQRIHTELHTNSKSPGNNFTCKGQAIHTFVSRKLHEIPCRSPLKVELSQLGRNLGEILKLKFS